MTNFSDLSESEREPYLDEAVRRLKASQPGVSWQRNFDASKALATTLHELGWKPPVDPLLLIEARKICAQDIPSSASDFLAGRYDTRTWVCIALTALKRGMEIERTKNSY